MSWNINTIGKSEDVAALVNKEQHIPQPLKDAVKLFAEAGANTATNQNYGALRVVSSGHFGPSDAWSSCTLTIERVSLAPSST
jgi:hypothetical protein